MWFLLFFLPTCFITTNLRNPLNDRNHSSYYNGRSITTNLFSLGLLDPLQYFKIFTLKLFSFVNPKFSNQVVHNNVSNYWLVIYWLVILHLSLCSKTSRRTEYSMIPFLWREKTIKLCCMPMAKHSLTWKIKQTISNIMLIINHCISECCLFKTRAMAAFSRASRAAGVRLQSVT